MTTPISEIISVTSPSDNDLDKLLRNDNLSSGGIQLINKVKNMKSTLKNMDKRITALESFHSSDPLSSFPSST